MKKIKIIILVGIIIFLVLATAGYFYYKQNNRTMTRRNFQVQLNSTQINDLKSFFSSTYSLEEIKNYCLTNKSYCFYYCRNINLSSEICKELGNYSRGNRNFWQQSK